jgi:hypothetical protein
MFDCTLAALSEENVNGSNLKTNNLGRCNSPGFKAMLYALKLPLYINVGLKLCGELQ